MTADRQATTAWAVRYRDLLREYIGMMGGDNITAMKRATAETLATLGVELSQLTDRFASGGRGASSDDLALYLKLSGTVTTLLESAGLQQPVTDQSGSDARDRLAALIGRIIHEQELEESSGIFRDDDGVIIVDPARIRLEQAIFALKQQRNSPPPLAEALLMIAPPSTSTPGPAPTPAPPSPVNVVDLATRTSGPRRATEDVIARADHCRAIIDATFSGMDSGRWQRR